MLRYYSQKYEISQIDDGDKKHVQLAWEFVGTPHVLKKLNWEGRARPDREQKPGVEKFVITQQLLDNFLTFSNFIFVLTSYFLCSRLTSVENPMKKRQFSTFFAKCTAYVAQEIQVEVV